MNWPNVLIHPQAYTQDVFSYFQAISPGKARRFLNSIGHRYTTNSILKSEIRVLKTLDYQTLVNSPLTFLETILEILGKQLKNWKSYIQFEHGKIWLGLIS